jgi:hypothetical protein
VGEDNGLKTDLDQVGRISADPAATKFGMSEKVGERDVGMLAPLLYEIGTLY